MMKNGVLGTYLHVQIQDTEFTAVVSEHVAGNPYWFAIFYALSAQFSQQFNWLVISHYFSPSDHITEAVDSV